MSEPDILIDLTDNYFEEIVMQGMPEDAIDIYTSNRHDQTGSRRTCKELLHP